MLQRKWVGALGIGLILVVGVATAAEAFEIGPPRPLSVGDLRAEVRSNLELSEFIARHGRPDWAEAQRVAVDRPLDPYEIRLYYLSEGIVASFTNARLVGGLAVSMRKWQRPLPADKRQRIIAELVATDPAVRAEVAAERAEMAARRVETAASAAEAAADTAASLVEAMARGSGRGSVQR